MDERHDARRDFSTGGRRAPIDQTPEYRSEIERLQATRRQQTADGDLGPMPRGYGDGDPRITLAFAGAWMLAAFAFGGLSFTVSGVMQMMLLGWAILFVAAGLVPMLLFSPLTRGFTGLRGAAAADARRDAFLVLILTFGGARMLVSGLMTMTPILPLLTVTIAAALLFAVLRGRLPRRAAIVLALTGALSVALAIWIGRALIFPLVMAGG